MQRLQLNHWLHAPHKDSYRTPKIYVIGCADVTQYLLAVEYKQQLELIKEGSEPMHFDSLERVKEELHRLGIDKAYLRLHNAYDECGSEGRCGYSDIALAVPLSPFY